MKSKTLLEQVSALPPEAQEKVFTFVGFLTECYRKQAARDTDSSLPTLAEEPFVGMWKHRKDMKNSTSWVRDVRTKEWRS